MNLTAIFESAELLFKQILEDFFIAVYSDKSPPSHNITHHRRVWNYAKELSLLLAGNNLIGDAFSASGLIIACYLHDIGISVDTGIVHGHHSREICIRFLEKNNLKTSEYTDVLDAIENHDNKEYKTSTLKHDLLTILTVADDLDAFGYIGVYRYCEIYLARGINPEILGYLIKQNAHTRFDYFSEKFGFSNDLLLKHSKRFNILEDFFNAYNNQISTYQFGRNYPSGYCGVVETILRIINKNLSLTNFFSETKKYTYDPVIKWFYNELESELSRLV